MPYGVILHQTNASYGLRGIEQNDLAILWCKQNKIYIFSIISHDAVMKKKEFNNILLALFCVSGN